MDKILKIEVLKKIFDFGFVIKVLTPNTIASALWVMKISTNADEAYLSSKVLVGALVDGEFDLNIKANDKIYISLKELYSVEFPTPKAPTEAKEKTEQKPRFLAELGSNYVDQTVTYKKKPVVVTQLGKAYVLEKISKGIPDWLFEKLKGKMVQWIYFTETSEQKVDDQVRVSAPEIKLQDQIAKIINAFKVTGEKTRNRNLIKREAPGNRNLMRYCDLRGIDEKNKVLFVESANFIWLLEVDRNDPLPNIKLANVAMSGWILQKQDYLMLIEQLKAIDMVIKCDPEKYIAK